MSERKEPWSMTGPELIEELSDGPLSSATMKTAQAKQAQALIAYLAAQVIQVETAAKEANIEARRLRELEYESGKANLQKAIDAAVLLAQERDAARAALAEAQDRHRIDVEALRRVIAERAATEARLATLEAAIRWALGEDGEFPLAPDGRDSMFWWRSGLRKRAALDTGGGK